jgi:hypothetical protein
VQHQEVLRIEATLTTDDRGEVLFTDLPVGRYRYRASAPNHQDTLGSFRVKAGVTDNVEVFLDYDLITVEWSVTEITLEDKYEITLRALFETDVPAAVVVLEPTSTPLPAMAPGEVFNGELRLTNYGLIRADDLAFDLPPDDAYYRYELGGGLPTSLGGKESLVIPYRVTALAPFAPDGSGSGGGCVVYTTTLRTTYAYDCANGTTTTGTSSHTWSRPIAGTGCGNSGSGPPAVATYRVGSPGTNDTFVSGSSSYDSIPSAQCVPEPLCPVGSCCKLPGGRGQ